MFEGSANSYKKRLCENQIKKKLDDVINNDGVINYPVKEDLKFLEVRDEK